MTSNDIDPSKEMKVKEMLSVFTKVASGNQDVTIIQSTAKKLQDLFMNSSSDDFDLLTMTWKKTRNNILYYAVDHNYEPIVIELINICKCKFPDRLVTFLNLQNDEGYSCLHVASIRGNKFDVRSIVRLLLENGADANLESNKKETPLHLCAKRINLAITNLLLQYNADISKRDINQMRPFQVIGLGYTLVTSADIKTSLEDRLRGTKGQLLDDELIYMIDDKSDITGEIVFISNESDEPELDFDYIEKSGMWYTFNKDKNYTFKINTDSDIEIESNLKLKIELNNSEESFKGTIFARRSKEEDNTFIFDSIVLHDPGVVNITVSLCNADYINIEPYICEPQEFKSIRNVNNTPKKHVTKKPINDDRNVNNTPKKHVTKIPINDVSSVDSSTDASSEMSEVEESISEETEMDELLRSKEEEISQKETAAPLVGDLLTKGHPQYTIWDALFKLVNKAEDNKMIAKVGHELGKLHTASGRRIINSMPVFDYPIRKMNILHRSCWFSNVQVVEMILRVTNDINTRTISSSTKDTFGGSTPCMIAAQRGNYDILEAILLHPFKSVSRSTYRKILSENAGDSDLLGNDNINTTTNTNTNIICTTNTIICTTNTIICTTNIKANISLRIQRTMI